MIYVLIAIGHIQVSYVYGGSMATFQEFGSLQACKDAATFLKGHYVEATCLPKVK